MVTGSTMFLDSRTHVEDRLRNKLSGPKF